MKVSSDFEAMYIMKITSRYNLYYTSIAKPQKCSFSQVWKKIPDLKYLLLRIFVIKQSSTFLQFDVKEKNSYFTTFLIFVGTKIIGKGQGSRFFFFTHICRWWFLWCDSSKIWISEFIEIFFFGSSWLNSWSIEVWSYENPSYLDLITSKINQTRRYSFGKIVL